MEPITDEWVTRHFDHLSNDLALSLHPTLALTQAAEAETFFSAVLGFIAAGVRR